MDTQRDGRPGASGDSDEALNRGTGRTTTQLVAAPQGAFYLIRHHGEFYHCQHLAHKVGRPDIRILHTGPQWEERFRGMRGAVLVVDHHASLSPREEQFLAAMGVEVRWYVR